MAKKKTNKYWRNKIDKLLAEHARGKRCAICNQSPAHYHHLLPKSRYACYRAEKKNLILLCPKHHTFGLECCAHSQNYLAVVAFEEWLKKNRPKQHTWATEAWLNKAPVRRIDYEELYKNMVKEFGIDQK